MKKINLATTKCSNPKCNARILASRVIKECPICRSKTKKDKEFTAQGFFDSDCVILKEKGRKNDNNRHRNIKK